MSEGVRVGFVPRNSLGYTYRRQRGRVLHAHRRWCKDTDRGLLLLLRLLRVVGWD